MTNCPVSPAVILLCKLYIVLCCVVLFYYKYNFYGCYVLGFRDESVRAWLNIIHFLTGAFVTVGLSL